MGCPLHASPRSAATHHICSFAGTFVSCRAPHPLYTRTPQAIGRAIKRAAAASAATHMARMNTDLGRAIAAAAAAAAAGKLRPKAPKAPKEDGAKAKKAAH